MQCTLRTIVLAGAVGLAAARAEDKPAAKSDPAAEAMMHKAHVARSSWGADFPGFQAKLEVSIDGDRVEGTVALSKSGEVTLKLPDGPAQKWAREQFESIAMHRTAEVRDKYDVSFADDVRHHPLGRLIRFHGGSTHSIYRIQDDVITEVHRTMDKMRFTISVTDVIRNDQGQTLPRHFNVSYWDAATGQLQSNNDFTDAWVHLGKFDLPKSRLLVKTSKDGRQVFEFRLSDHELTGAQTSK
jgi:hypothetical protein